MRFEDVVGQEAVKGILRQRVVEGRMPHAIMLSGPSGAGGFGLALALVQFMACPNRTEEDSCGTCPTCRKLSKLAHPDLHFCMPLIRNRESDDPAVVEAEMLEALRAQLDYSPYFSEPDWYARLGDSSKQGSISAASSRRVIETLWLKSFELPYKFMVVWLPERLNAAAANRLLKLVEEPPEGTFFLFVSIRPHDVLPTIQSRVQQTILPPLAPEEVVRALEGMALAEMPLSAEIARACQGSFTEALHMVDDEGGNEYLPLMQSLYRFAISRNYVGLMEWVDEVVGLSREKQKGMLTFFALMVREMYMFNLGQSDLCFTIGREREFAEKVSPYIHGRNIGWLLDEYNTGLFQVGRNGKASIIFTDMAIRHARMVVLKVPA